jgi:hypothetical protein
LGKTKEKNNDKQKGLILNNIEIEKNNNPKPQTSNNNNNITNFNLTSKNRPFTMKKPQNSTIFFPVNQVSNSSTNNFNVMLSSMPMINENQGRVLSALRKENENKPKLNLNNYNDPKKRDSVTQTEEIFFRM